MQIPLVTISYNHKQHLLTAAHSAMSQRDDGLDVEYVVVDVLSDDDSQAFLQDIHDGVDHLIVEKDTGPTHGLE